MDRAFIQELEPQLIADRRDLHQHPELGFEEHRTGALVAQRLDSLGYDTTTGIARTGVLGVLRSGRPGPVVLLRADMDALPIDEENNVSYRSQTPGVMHACGHDAHTAMLLGVAAALAHQRDELAGTVKLAFQPAEENYGGAEPMIAAGVMNDPPVDGCFGLHVDQETPVGTISVRPGPMFAAEDDFRIKIQGKGGHAALPHRAIDATLVAAEVVVALQTLVSREVDPLELAVVTVGMLRSGVAGNVIADRAELAGTVRTFDPEVRHYLSRRVPELATSVATGMRATIEIDYELGYPAVVNDPAMTDIVRRAAAATLGAGNVLEAEPTLGADDMSYFLEAAPGCYFFVGSNDEASGKVYTHHHPRFDIDERCLVIGVETLVRTVELFQQDWGDSAPRSRKA